MQPIVRASLVTLAALATSACGGGQPRIFKVALDRTAQNQITTSSCYINSTSPQYPERTSQNLFEDATWVIWDGDQQELFLDVGSLSVGLAHAAPLRLDELVKGNSADKIFTAVKTQTCVGNFGGGATPACAPSPNALSQINWVAKFTFEQLGNTIKGNLDVTSDYSCQGNACPMGGMVPYTSCKNVLLPFSGRKIEGSNQVQFENSGSTP